jgi:TIR domain
MIFLSYSHQDTLWMERVASHLQVLVDSDALQVWDDRHIRAGQDWLPEVEKALDTAKVAVLLISIEFINSHFVRNAEVPGFLPGGRSRGSE